MSLADSIRRRTDEWVERKQLEARDEGRAEGRKQARAELLREFLAAREEGRLDELLAAYNYQPSDYETQYPENRG